MQSESVLTFWFEELTAKQWYKVDPVLDDVIHKRFGECHLQACRAELFDWRKTARGRLAEVIVLDQFSRNLFRGDARAYSSDPLALALSQEAINQGSDLELEPGYRAFLYMPFMHSESAAIHEVAVSLFSQPGMENNLDFELRHKAIIDRFDRYPHRNDQLGRISSPEEEEFLQGDGSSF